MAPYTRSTLPPLHSLGLPRGDIPHELNQPGSLPKPLHVPSARPDDHPPPTPTPSAMTLQPPPGPGLRPSTNTSMSTSSPTLKIHLVPSSLESADAVVLVSPPTGPGTLPPQHLFLVGPALQRLRHRERPIAEGARVHPYRVARPSDRRPPTNHPAPRPDEQHQQTSSVNERVA